MKSFLKKMAYYMAGPVQLWQRERIATLEAENERLRESLDALLESSRADGVTRISPVMRQLIKKALATHEERG